MTQAPGACLAPGVWMVHCDNDLMIYHSDIIRYTINKVIIYDTF